MKRLYLFLLAGMGIFQYCAISALAWDFPLNIDVTGIEFRYSTSAPAVPLKKISGSNIVTIDTPEWEYDPTEKVLLKNEKFAYIKDDDPQIYANFYASSYDSPVLTIQAYPVMYCFDWRLSGNVNFTTNESGYKVFITESGYHIPSEVGIYSVLFSWRVVAIGGVPQTPIHLANTEHNFYSLYYSPGSFDDGNDIGTPWTDILDRACIWAAGQTTASGCLSSLTTGLYNYSKMKYTLNSHWADHSTIDLKHILTDLNNTSTYEEGNFLDYSSFLNMLVYSIGLSSSGSDCCKYATLGPSFQTKYILPAQHADSSSYGWGEHQVAYFQDTYMADASAKVYSGGNWILSKGDKT